MCAKCLRYAQNTDSDRDEIVCADIQISLELHDKRQWANGVGNPHIQVHDNEHFSPEEIQTTFPGMSGFLLGRNARPLASLDFSPGGIQTHR